LKHARSRFGPVPLRKLLTTWFVPISFSKTAGLIPSASQAIFVMYASDMVS
jgi:hypothetical protein